MANQIDITVKQVRALLAVAPTKDVRYYLNGALFDFETGRVVVTDGKILVAASVPGILDDIAYGTVIIGVDDLKTVSTGGKAADTITIEYGESGCTMHRWNGATVQVQTIDGQYPDYSRIIPDTISGVTAQYDPELLARANKALQGLTDTKNAMYLLHNGTGPGVGACTGLESEAFAVIMPYRADITSENPAKDFFAGTPAKREAA